jgi:hypothetical protein
MVLRTPRDVAWAPAAALAPADVTGLPVVELTVGDCA